MRPIQKTTTHATRWGMALGGMALLVLLGCIGPPSENNGGLFDLAPIGGDDAWEDDVKERREARDNPGSPDYRGYFDVTLTGDHDTTLNSFELGESTFMPVSSDLAGSPPHCLLTLADRTPDAEGRQGYLLLQFLGDDCDVRAGEYAVVSSLDEAREGGAVVLKTVQVDTTTKEIYRFESFVYPTGTLKLESSRNTIEGTLSVELVGVRVDDEERAQTATLMVRGAFEAIARAN